MGRRDRGAGFNQPFGGLAKLKTPALPSLTVKKAAPERVVVATPKHQTDEELFLAEVSGVKEIPHAHHRVGGPAQDAKQRVRRPSDDAEVLAQLADLCDGAGTFDIADSDEYIEGIADGIDRRLLKRLRAGDYALQAHVDLHGATRPEAREKVARFLGESRRAGLRCVLIVHGRGNHSKDQIPVLKLAVKSWLERGQVARMVLAYTTARPADGGAGAVYVLLRR